MRIEDSRVPLFPFSCCPLIHTSRRADLLVRERCMNLLDTEQKSAGGAIVSDIANTRLSGSWLIAARVVWLALVVPSLGLFLANLLVYYQQLQRACAGPLLCNLPGALTAKELQTLPTNRRQEGPCSSDMGANCRPSADGCLIFLMEYGRMYS